MTSELTMLCSITNAWLSFFAAKGLKTETLIASAELDPRLLKDVDNRIPYDKHIKMVEIGMEQLDDPAIGLHFAEFIHPDQLGILGQFVISSRTIREAIVQLTRYADIAVPKLKWELIEKRNSAIFRHSLGGEDPIRAREIVIGGIMIMIRMSSNQEVKAREVHFQHQATSYVDEYERVFGCRPLFSQRINSIEFDRDYLSVKLPHFSPYIARLIDQYAGSLIKTAKAGNKVEDLVRQVILENLHTGSVDIEFISRKLSISRWTLARKLIKANTTFSNILQSLQKQMALRYLQSHKHTVEEIALLSGFSTRSSFNRAFKRWTGKKPSEYFFKQRYE